MLSQATSIRKLPPEGQRVWELGKKFKNALKSGSVTFSTLAISRGRKARVLRILSCKYWKEFGLDSYLEIFYLRKGRNTKFNSQVHVHHPYKLPSGVVTAPIRWVPGGEVWSVVGILFIFPFNIHHFTRRYSYSVLYKWKLRFPENSWLGQSNTESGRNRIWIHIWPTPKPETLPHCVPMVFVLASGRILSWFIDFAMGPTAVTVTWFSLGA